MGWASPQVGWFGSVTGIGDDGLKNPDNYLNTLLHQTRDGGETWQPVLNLPRATSAGICGFYAVNEQVAYGAGTNDPGLPGPTVIKTLDGGNSWELIDMSAHADNLIDIYFQDENTGFVVGGKIQTQCSINYAAYPPPRLIRYAQLKPVVLKTTDGGKTWSNMAANTAGLQCGEWGWKIQFINERSGFISLENFASAAILKTSDGGETWQRLDVKDSCGEIINKDLEGIGFINENQGWVGGWGNNFTGLMNCYTRDGGLTWQSQDHNAEIPHSDQRLRINRYRFIGNSPRIEPAHSDEKVNKACFSASSKSNSIMNPHDFALEYAQRDDGKVEISYELPGNAENIFIGLWNQFAFYVKTLVHEKVQHPGRQRIIWDGSDDAGNDLANGVYICRLSADGLQGGSQMVTLARSFEDER